MFGFNLFYYTVSSTIVAIHGQLPELYDPWRNFTVSTDLALIQPTSFFCSHNIFFPRYDWLLNTFVKDLLTNEWFCLHATFYPHEPQKKAFH